jgi:hypothetical protein
MLLLLVAVLGITVAVELVDIEVLLLANLLVVALLLRLHLL